MSLLLGVLSSQSVGFSPNSLSGLAAWYDAADASTITESSGAVSQWDDKSSNGFHLTQATGASQPATGNSTLNSLNVIDFNADYMSAASASDWTFMHDGTNYFIAAVIKIGTTANPNTLYGVLATSIGQTTSHGFQIMHDDRSSLSRNNFLQHAVSNNANPQPVSHTQNDYYAANSFKVLQIECDPDNATAANRSKFFIDTSSATTGNTNTATPSSSTPASPLRLGVRGDEIFPLVGAVGEIVIVKGADATSANRELVRDYLISKWGL